MRSPLFVFNHQCQSFPNPFGSLKRFLLNIREQAKSPPLNSNAFRMWSRYGEDQPTFLFLFL